jgi:hypothetical protein
MCMQCMLERTMPPKIDQSAKRCSHDLEAADCHNDRAANDTHLQSEVTCCPHVGQTDIVHKRAADTPAGLTVSSLDRPIGYFAEGCRIALCTQVQAGQSRAAT